MKNRLVVILALCIVIPSVALSATDDAKANDQIRVSRSPISESENPSSIIHSTSPASGVTAKPANGGHFKTGQRKVAWD